MISTLKLEMELERYYRQQEALCNCGVKCKWKKLSSLKRSVPGTVTQQVALNISLRSIFSK